MLGKSVPMDLCESLSPVPCRVVVRRQMWRNRVRSTLLVQRAKTAPDNSRGGCSSDGFSDGIESGR